MNTGFRERRKVTRRFGPLPWRQGRVPWIPAAQPCQTRSPELAVWEPEHGPPDPALTLSFDDVAYNTDEARSPEKKQEVFYLS